MPDLLQLLTGQLEGRVGDIGRQIGADPNNTERGIEMALPLLMGALANNAGRSTENASQLARALDRDHSPELLDQLGGLLGGSGGGAGGGLGAVLGGLLGGGGARSGGGGGLGSLLEGLAGGGPKPAGLPKSLDAGGILGHILGPKKGAVTSGIERGSGLSGQQVMKLLLLLAPLVMSALSKVKQQQRLDGPGLANVLQQQRKTMEQRTPQLGGRGFSDLLDQNDDGSIADDLARIGVSLGGPLFGRR